jgi:hypothetical protein
MYQQKVVTKTLWKYALFPLLLMFSKLVLRINFFAAFLKNFSADFNGLVLFSNFEAKRAKNGAKNQKKNLSKCFLDLNSAPIKGSVFLIFCKKIRCIQGCE